MQVTPRFLLIESTTAPFSIAFSFGLEIIDSVTHDEPKALNALITGFIEQLSRDTGIKLIELDGVVVSTGPGSYTGIRIGYAVAKGICIGCDLPLIEVSTLDALALAALPSCRPKDLVLSNIDARRDEVYGAIYDHEGKLLLPPKSLNYPLDLDIGWDGRLVLAGDGSAKALTLNNNELIDSQIRQHASHLLPIALEKFSKQDFSPVDSSEPFYLKAPNITASKSLYS